MLRRGVLLGPVVGREERLVALLLGLVLALTTAAPLASLLLDSRRLPDLEGNDRDILRLLDLAARAGELFLRSTVLSAAVALGAVLLGAPLGVLLAKSDLTGRRFALLVHAFPLFLPPFFLALGWFDLLFAGAGGDGELARRLLFSPVGFVVVLTLIFTPLVTALTALALAGIDTSLEEAARTVARPWRVATRILLPLCAPALALGAFLVFTLTFSELGVSMFLRVETYPSALFARLGGIDYAPGEAVQLALPLLCLTLGLLWAERALARRLSVASLGSALTAAPTLALGRWRPAVGTLVWVVVLASVLPLLGLALAAARGEPTALADWLGHSVRNSLRSALWAASLVTLFALLLGHALARGRTYARALDALCFLGFVTPAALLGLGLIGLWNHPNTQFVYASAAIIVLGYTARYAAIGVRTAALSIAQSPAELEEAAAVSGAGFFRRLRRIVVPLHARGLLVAWVLVLVFCLRDTETAVLFYPPGGEPLPVRILTLEANGPPEVVAGLALVHVVLTALVLLLGGALLRLRGWRR